MTDIIWQFDEPHISGGNSRVTLTQTQAIEWMRGYYARGFPPGNAPKMTDEELLNKFAALHWAKPIKWGYGELPQIWVDEGGVRLDDIEKEINDQNNNTRNISSRG